MSRNQRIVLVGLAVIVAAVAVIIAISSGSDDKESADRPSTVTTGSAKGSQTTDSQPKGSEPTGVRQVTVVVRDGKPVGGVRELNYEKGDTIDLRVRSDSADEVHFHGYELTREVSPGGSVKFRFRADIEGRFEVELHHSGQQIADVRVNP